MTSQSVPAARVGVLAAALLLSAVPLLHAASPAGSGAPPERCCDETFAPLVRRLRPSVVNIQTEQIVDEEGPRGGHSFNLFELPSGPVRRHALGSGFIIDPGGYVVTNNHVVKDASVVKIKLADGREYRARVVGSDQKTDLALLKIDGAKNLPTVVLGDSSTLQVGDWVLAIGNPFGLGNTVTAGIVSAKERYIASGPYDDFLQTDASINPGNSGGPLFDLSGEVVGVNTAIVAGGQGIGFAIPINLAALVVRQLRTAGYVTRGVLGIGIQDVTPPLARALGLQKPEGALVSSVDAGGPADRAGLRVGDVILEFAGQPIHEANRLPLLVAETPPGTRQTIRFSRDGAPHAAQVTVGAQRDAVGTAAPPPRPRGPSDRIGIEAVTMTPAIAGRFNLPSVPGALITGVAPDGVAAGQLVAGDIVVQANRHAVNDVKQLQAAARSAPPGGVLLLLVRRGDGALFVALELP